MSQNTWLASNTSHLQTGWDNNFGFAGTYRSLEQFYPKQCESRTIIYPYLISSLSYNKNSQQGVVYSADQISLFNIPVHHSCTLLFGLPAKFDSVLHMTTPVRHHTYNGATVLTGGDTVASSVIPV
jgi:hypothetical protein